MPAVYLEQFNSADHKDPIEHNRNEPAASKATFETKIIQQPLPPRNDLCCSSWNSANTSSSAAFAMDSEVTSGIETCENNADEEADMFYAVEDYLDTVGDGVNLTRGDQVQVLNRQSSTGWWFVRLSDGCEGWAPGSFLLRKEKTNRPPPRPANSVFLKDDRNNTDESSLKSVKVSEMRKLFESNK